MPEWVVYAGMLLFALVPVALLVRGRGPHAPDAPPGQPVQPEVVTPTAPPPAAALVWDRPCAVCGHTEHAWYPMVAFEHAEGAHRHRFGLVVCTGCSITHFVASPSLIQQAHTLVQASPP